MEGSTIPLRSVLRSVVICRKAAGTNILSQHVNLAVPTDSQGYHIKINRAIADGMDFNWTLGYGE